VAGDKRLIVDYKGWRICPMVCYDLRFPVWARNDAAYDLLIYTANWPEKRAYDWNTLLKARAIENQCYTIGVNRVGTDANGHVYNGDSCVIDPGWRHTLYHVEEEEAVHTETLSMEHLLEVRRRLPFLTDRDGFTVTSGGANL
jgi:predicted amidohydrolase